MPSCITVASVWTKKLLVLILCLSIVDHPISVKYTYLACQNCTSIYVVLTTLTELPNQSTGDSPIITEETSNLCIGSDTLNEFYEAEIIHAKFCCDFADNPSVSNTGSNLLNPEFKSIFSDVIKKRNDELRKIEVSLILTIVMALSMRSH